MPETCPGTRGEKDVSLSSEESESESVSMWSRGVQTALVSTQEVGTQTTETSMGLKSYAKAQLTGRPASLERKRSLSLIHISEPTRH
eukprot:4271908-Karenia_brevis.AAC.1